MKKERLTTISGLDFYTVASAFQKTIRRGMEQEALFYGTELMLSDYDEFAWFRMRVIVSEDIGVANPTLPAQIEALYTSFGAMKAMKNRHAPERLPFVHAIMLLARSPKSRLVDNKLSQYFSFRETLEIPETPDFVFDKHTKKGKEMGRGFEHFFSEAAQLANVPEELEEEEKEWHERTKGLFVSREMEKRGKTD